MNNISFLKYFYLLLNTWFIKISNIENELIVRIKNSINVALSYNGSNINYWIYILTNDTERHHLINLGSLQGYNFINNLENKSITNQLVNTYSEKTINVSSNLLDKKIIYLLNYYFKFVVYIFYIYIIFILCLFYKKV